ncbi:hypothetical protein OS189_14235 [Sulfitobacter sp. F26169L]|uniref:hypothetical protein n=1 Tax=Sulfitobacter sp. F26169L TaxID=2996015 RepID=UPI0022609F6A|nr:hypothetical protein [Sulfitobacter sp. F26169L]MCX7567504.1 hypothetical protein [Sulfitobacter sp. F26169L]
MTWVIFAAATVFATLILNRWIVSDLGLLSFGRVWQLYISYADFGFMRRGFIGTLLSETGVNTLFPNEYVFAHLIQFLAIAALALLTAMYCITNGLKNPLFLFGIAFSPAFLTHSGYATGTLDVFVLLIVLANILYVRHYAVFSVLILIGVLTHELFIFTLPAQFLALHLNYRSKAPALDLAYWVPALTVLLSTLFVVLFGQVGIPEAEFEELMRAHLPNANEQHPLWSGYFEVGSEVARSISESHHLFLAVKEGRIVFLLPVLLYVGLLTLRALQYVRGNGEIMLVIAAVVAPLMASFLANDFHRWGGMGANMALLLTLRLAVREGDETSKWNLILAFCCLLAPFGAAELERPFPLHSFVVESLWPS